MSRSGGKEIAASTAAALLAACLGCGMGGYVPEGGDEASPRPGAKALAAQAGEGARGATAPVNEIVLPEPGKLVFLTARHFVRDWAVLGPFEYDKDSCTGDQCQGSMDTPYVSDEAGLRPAVGRAVDGKTWRRYSVASEFSPGFVDLDAFYDRPEHVVSYAVAEVVSPKAMSGLSMLFGSDDYLKVWLNGELVHTYAERRRSAEWDQDTVEDVSLNAGSNRLVVKCGEVVGEYGFYARFAAADGDPIRIVTPD